MNRKKSDHYTYRVTWSEEDQEHVGLCAEFPSLSYLAKAPEAALRPAVVRRPAAVRRPAESIDQEIVT